MAEKAKMLRVYTIVERPRQEPFWLNIGSAFEHEDGKGWNVLLQALPIGVDGQAKIVLREYEPKDKAEAAGQTLEPKKG